MWTFCRTQTRQTVRLKSPRSLLNSDVCSILDDLLNYTQTVLAELSAFTSYVVDINICQEVDVGGLRGEQPNLANSEDPYLRAVAEARSLLRRFEAIIQGVYDDGSMLFTFAQTVPFKWACTGSVTDTIDRQSTISSLYGSARVLKTETSMAIDYLEKLLSVAKDQVASEGRFRESVALRISRMSIMDGNRRLSNFFGPVPDTANEEEDVVDMDFAFRKGTARPAMRGLDALSTEAGAVEPRMPREEMSSFEQATGHKKSFSSSTDVAIEQDLSDDEDVVEKSVFPSFMTSAFYLFVNQGLDVR